jgi:hypothetical protein
MEQLKDKRVPEEIAHFYGQGPDKGLEFFRICFEIGQVFPVVSLIRLLESEFELAQDCSPAVKRKINAPHRIDMFQKKLQVVLVAAVPNDRPLSYSMIILFIFGLFYDQPHWCDIIFP